MAGDHGDYSTCENLAPSLVSPTWFNVFGEKHNEQWRYKIIEALYVSAGWMSNCPYVQDPFKQLQTPIISTGDDYILAIFHSLFSYFPRHFQ